MGSLTVDAVLFDSGGVLIGPVGGRWNPRFDFEEIVARRAPHLTSQRLAIAIDIGDEYLAASGGTPKRADYHRVMLDVLGVEASTELLTELDEPLDPAVVVEPFPEVIEVLDELRARGLRLAVVSDAWPTRGRTPRGSWARATTSRCTRSPRSSDARSGWSTRSVLRS